jgi:ribosomal protein S18 acetylase RimI-like enzyme
VTQDSPPPESTTSLNPSKSSSATSSSKKPVGTVRFTPSLGKISRLAILADYRKYGFGKELMDAVEQHARSHKPEDLTKCLTEKEGGRRVVQLKCNSQMQVVKFYERQGFRKEGPEFDEEGGKSGY